MLYVFHNKKFLEFHFTDKLGETTMTHVANVDTSDPETAFRLTNHIDNDWELNPGVVAKKGRHRSTSVGDLIVDGTPASLTSKHYLVDSLGFRELTAEEITDITFAFPTE